jgi:hypothetical protein
MSRFHPLWISALVLAASQASATPIITVGSHDLLPNTANQWVNIFSSDDGTGSNLVQGINLYLQVGDGTAGPEIQAIDVLAGTIFATTGWQSSGALGGSYSLPYWNGYGTTGFLSGGSVADNGLLATVKIDTTGFTAGTWNLSADFDYGVDYYASDFAGVTPTFRNGSISIVPEPAGLLLLLMAAAGLAVRQWRLRREG